jgi:outer membrane protein
MLRITVNEIAGEAQLKLEGKLKGPWVLELERCIQGMQPGLGMVINLAEVEFVDTAGRYLLMLMQERGVRFIATSPLMLQLVRELSDRHTRGSQKIGRTFCVIFFFLLSLFPGWSSSAQEPPVRLTLAQTAALASERNLQVMAAKQGAATAKYTLAQAKALRYGKVDLNASYLRLNDSISIESGSVYVPLFGGINIAVPPVIVAPADLAHVRLEAGLPLFTGGKITNAIGAARAGQQAAEALSDDIEAASVLESCRLYLGALLARDVFQMNRQALESYHRHLEDADRAYRMGAAAHYDVVRAEVAVAEQEKRLTEAQNRCDLVEAALKTALNFSDSAQLEIHGVLFEPPLRQTLAEMQAKAISGNPALEALHKNIEALERATRMERGDYLPQILAVAGKETVTSKLAQTDPNWFAGVQATWTLFDGGVRRARIASKISEAEQARIEERHAEEQIRLAVHGALLDYESQKSALASARKAAELARESLNLATKRFAAGAGTSLEVLDANVALTAAETGARNSLFQMDESFLRIHRYIGDIGEIAAQIQ